MGGKWIVERIEEEDIDLMPRDGFCAILYFRRPIKAEVMRKYGLDDPLNP